MVENYKRKYLKYKNKYLNLIGGETVIDLFVSWYDENNEKQNYKIIDKPVSTTLGSIIDNLPDYIKICGDGFYGPIGMNPTIQKYDNDNTLSYYNIQNNSYLKYRVDNNKHL